MTSKKHTLESNLSDEYSDSNYTHLSQFKEQLDKGLFTFYREQKALQNGSLGLTEWLVNQEPNTANKKENATFLSGDQLIRKNQLDRKKFNYLLPPQQSRKVQIKPQIICINYSQGPKKCWKTKKVLLHARRRATVENQFKYEEQKHWSDRSLSKRMFKKKDKNAQCESHDHRKQASSLKMMKKKSFLKLMEEYKKKRMFLAEQCKKKAELIAECTIRKKEVLPVLNCKLSSLSNQFHRHSLKSNILQTIRNSKQNSYKDTFYFN